MMNYCFTFRCVETPNTECLFLSNVVSSCWLFVTDQPRTWTQALDDCFSRGGHLMVETPDDLELRQRLSTELGSRPAQQSWWIGLGYNLLDLWTWGGGNTIGSHNLIIVQIIKIFQCQTRNNFSLSSSISFSNISSLQSVEPCNLLADYDEYHPNSSTDTLADPTKLCIRMVYMDRQTFGKWEPLSCDTQLPFLCQYRKSK